MSNPSKPRPFWLNLIIILGIVSLIALVAFLIFQDTAASSNVYFLAAVVLWIIAAVPIFTEVGGNVRITRKARKEGSSAREMIRGHEDKYRQGGRITYLFGLSGIICFLLAFVTLGI